MSLSDVDFLRRPAQPLAGWWILATGVILLAGSLTFANRWRTERQAADVQEQAILMSRQTRLKPAAPPTQSVAQRRWSQARSELSKPWTAVLNSVESATHEPIYLLSLNIEPATGIIHVEGEAPGFDQALDYVQALGAEPSLTSATLVSHAEIEPGTTPDGAPAFPTQFSADAPPRDRPIVRFSALTHWRQP